jgi:transglutaminase-like putative cysteine protease
MLFSVRHRTVYRYAEPVTLANHLAHLRPIDGPGQTCRRHSLAVSPLPTDIEESRDYFGNFATAFTISEAHTTLTVEAESEVDRDLPPLLPAESPSWEQVRDALAHAPTEADRLAAEFVAPSRGAEAGDQVAAYARTAFPEGMAIADAAFAFTRRIHEEFAFSPGATGVSTAPEEVLKLRRGVCQDFAHLMIAGCRSLGLAARYVSGYLETAPPGDGMRLVGADVSHAWVQVYLGEGAWADLDPTNNCTAGIGHITTAIGRDYGDVSPLGGVILGGGAHRVEVAVEVERRLL